MKKTILNKAGSAFYRNREIVLCAAGALLASGVASVCLAARPLNTDDARLTDPGACQLETWRRNNRDSKEFWALPACNPTGNLEMTLGGNDLPDGSGGRAHDMVVQGKTLFRELETGGYGIGLAAGMVRHTDPGPGQGRLSSAYFYVPASKSFLKDQIVVHLNLGAQNNRDTGTIPLTWGLGTEVNITPRFALIAETYGDNHTQHFYQAGVRTWVIPNRWQIDTTFGAQSGNIGASRWWTIGIRLITPPFL
jgi:hypothetical protein